MLVQMPKWTSSALTTIRPSAYTNADGTASGPANAYDGSLASNATLQSFGGTPTNCIVTYTTFPTLTLPNSGTLTVRRDYTVSKVLTSQSSTKLEISFNSGSTWSLIENSTHGSVSQPVGDVTYPIPSSTAMGTVQVRCSALASGDNTLDATLDVYDIRVDY